MKKDSLLVNLIWIVFAAFILAGCGSSGISYDYGQDHYSDSATRGFTKKNFTSTDDKAKSPHLLIVPDRATIALGATKQFTAYTLDSKGTLKDVSAEVSWASSTPEVASLSSNLATGLSPGLTTIKAALGDETATALLVVSGNTLEDIGLDEEMGDISGVSDLNLQTNASFSTDTGLLTPENGTPSPVLGWDANSKRLTLGSFSVGSGVTLKITGSHPFSVLAAGSIAIVGRIDFAGAPGSAGAQGVDSDGADGGDGANGGSVSLLAQGNLTISGSIKTSGGTGGEGGKCIIASSNMGPAYSGGKGGRGGNAGVITLDAGSSKSLEGASLDTTGGAGGAGGSLLVSRSNGSIYGGTANALGGEGGAGGSGVNVGGSGGAGGSVIINSSNNAEAMANGGDGGAGGAAMSTGGPGGVGGSVTIKQDNFAIANGGVGGAGGGGATKGGAGGNGGNVVVSGFNRPGAKASGGNGGDGGRPNGVGGSGGTANSRGGGGTLRQGENGGP